MTASESAPTGSPASAAAMSAGTFDEPSGELSVTVDLPVSDRAQPSPSRLRRKPRAEKTPDADASSRRDESSGSGGDAAPSGHQPLFAPAKRPGRRVVRIIRHVQLWSVFKVALLGGLVFYAVFLITVGLAWSLANSTGQIHHIEQFMRQIGFDNWSFNGPALFRFAAVLGAVLLVVGSVAITLAAAIVNLIAEATGGIRLTVIEVDETDDDD